MANCWKCGKQLAFLERLGGMCGDCIAENQRVDEAPANAQSPSQQDPSRATIGTDLGDLATLAAIILTTESSHNFDIAQRLEIIAAECVLGMNIFKDIGSAMRDFVGGRNEAYQTALRDARKSVLAELRREALKLGADAVVAVDLNYSEISGGGKSMLFLVASGTAVRLNKVK